MGREKALKTFSRKFSRRRFLKLGGAGLAGAALLGVAGCGGDEQQQQQGGGEETIQFGFIPDEAGGLRKLIDEFNQQHEGELRVDWREMPSDSVEYFDQLRTEFQAGSPTLDLIGGDVIWTAQLAAPGYILDLSDRFGGDMRGDHLEGQVDAITYEGRVWGVPWFTDAGMFYYRTDLLEEAGFSGPPQTWDEMKEMTLGVREATGENYGFVFQGSQDEGGVADALEYIWNAGGDVLDGDLVVINSPASIAGLQMRRSMLEDGISPISTGQYNTQESQAAFTRGDAVFMRNWPFVYGLLYDEDETNVQPEQVDIAPIPVMDPDNESFSALGGWNFFVSAASEDKLDQIWTFIEYMVAPEQQRTFAVESTRLPTLQSLYEDQELLDEVPVAARGKEAIQNARPRPVSPYYSDISLVMSEQFNAQLNGNISAEQAVQTLEEQMQGMFERAE